MSEQTTLPPADLHDRVAEQGFALLRGVFGPACLDGMVEQLEPVLATAPEESALRSSEGGVYGARNVLTLWPAIADCWRRPPLPEALAGLLGREFGLVRVLYFDKPPGETWALPWHKDLTVAVRDNRRASTWFSKPTRKAGIPHVEAPCEVLEAMLTARIHLDEVTDENGPLKVLPGSHRDGKTLRLGEIPPVTILANRGDVLLMRPLLVHSSARSHPESQRHRRILHLEFAAARTLPDGFEWHDYRR
jgi:hypothetical protein